MKIYELIIIELKNNSTVFASNAYFGTIEIVNDKIDNLENAIKNNRVDFDKWNELVNR